MLSVSDFPHVFDPNFKWKEQGVDLKKIKCKEESNYTYKNDI